MLVCLMEHPVPLHQAALQQGARAVKDPPGLCPQVQGESCLCSGLRLPSCRAGKHTLPLPRLHSWQPGLSARSHAWGDSCSADDHSCLGILQHELEKRADAWDRATQAVSTPATGLLLASGGKGPRPQRPGSGLRLASSPGPRCRRLLLFSLTLMQTRGWAGTDVWALPSKGGSCGQPGLTGLCLLWVCLSASLPQQALAPNGWRHPTPPGESLENHYVRLPMRWDHYSTLALSANL